MIRNHRVSKAGKYAMGLAAVAALAGVSAWGQYTPGSGGSYQVPAVPDAPAPQPYQPQPTYVPQPPDAGQPQYAPQPSYVPAPMDPNAPPSAEPVQIIEAPAPPPVPQLSPDQVGDLTSSVALYPDALLAEMLPAATYAEELTFADKWLAQHQGADEGTIAALPLEEPVKAMMHYPTVLSMMTDHLDWTQGLGLAFVYQRGDVMDSIQRWRMTAVQVGALASSPQQEVLQQGQTIMIVPAPQTQVVYVPVYDPEVVYVRHERPVRNMITFGGDGFSVAFVANDVDWRGHDVRVPVHHDWDDDRRREEERRAGHDDGRPDRPAGGPPEVKTGFVKNVVKPPVVYPAKIVAPTGSHKVITPPPAPPKSAATMSTRIPAAVVGQRVVAPPKPVTPAAVPPAAPKPVSPLPEAAPKAVTPSSAAPKPVIPAPIVAAPKGTPTEKIVPTEKTVPTKPVPADAPATVAKEPAVVKPPVVAPKVVTPTAVAPVPPVTPVVGPKPLPPKETVKEPVATDTVGRRGTGRSGDAGDATTTAPARGNGRGNNRGGADNNPATPY